jgi:sugar lactone lactonase YvrE
VRIGGDDRLYVYASSSRSIVSYSTATTVASDEKTFATNPIDMEDFVITQTGVIYFVDGSAGTIGRIDPAGHVSIEYRSGDSGGELEAKGLALSPDQGMLIVTDPASRFSWSLQIAADGSLENGEPFYRLEMPETGRYSGAMRVATDAGGAAYFVTAGRIQVCEPSGRVIEILNVPEFAPEAGWLESIAFAGANPSWLYVSQGGKLYRRPVRVTYAPAWAPVKPPKPLL